MPHPRVHFNRLSNCRVGCDIACPLVSSTLDQVSFAAVEPLATTLSTVSLMPYVPGEFPVFTCSSVLCRTSEVDSHHDTALKLD